LTGKTKNSATIEKHQEKTLILCGPKLCSRFYVTNYWLDGKNARQTNVVGETFTVANPTSYAVMPGGLSRVEDPIQKPSFLITGASSKSKRHLDTGSRTLKKANSTQFRRSKYCIKARRKP